MKPWLLASFVAAQSVRHQMEVAVLVAWGFHGAAKLGNDLAEAEAAAALRLLQKIGA